MEALQLGADAQVSVIITDDETPIIIPTSEGEVVSIVLDDGVVVVAGSNAPDNYSFVPPSALSTWMIPHDLGRRPNVMVLDGDGIQVFANVTHFSASTLMIEFSQPFIGRAELS